ncbi:MAG: HEAT repeat domain-containing protein, partial [Polyangiaceae bacterium]|nr:HEAT repeat domain-containing protein [Polyangiaceae bacterium]
MRFSRKCWRVLFPLVAGGLFISVFPRDARGQVWPSEVQQLAEALTSEDVERELQASERLPRLTRAQLVEVLVPCLQASSSVVLGRCLSEARRVNHPKVNRSILSLNALKSPALRAARLEAFSSLNESGAAELVQRALFDAEPVVREAALRVFVRAGDVGGPDVLRQLFISLADPSPEIRRFSLVQLSTMAETDVAVSVAALLSDPEADVRQAAVQSLGVIAPLELLAFSQALHDEKDPQVVEAFLTALVSEGSHAAWGEIAHWARHADSSLATLAWRRLALHPANEAPLIREFLDSLAPIHLPGFWKEVGFQGPPALTPTLSTLAQECVRKYSPPLGWLCSRIAGRGLQGALNIFDAANEGALDQKEALAAISLSSGAFDGEGSGQELLLFLLGTLSSTDYRL